MEKLNCGKFGGSEFLRTERMAEAEIRAEAEADEDDEDVVDDEALLAVCEDNEDDCAAFALLSKLSVAVTVAPGGPCITCMGCEGGERGQLPSKRLTEDSR